MKELSELRDRICLARESGNRRMSHTLRLEVGVVTLRQRAAGLPARTVAAELGVSKTTVYSCCEMARVREFSGDTSPERSTSGLVRPVSAVAEVHERVGLSIRLPSGMRVIDVNLEDIVALEKALS